MDTALSLDRTLQDLPPLGLRTPLGHDVQPLQPPAPLGHQVQLQPLPPLGTSHESFAFDDAIATSPPESDTEPDYSSELTTNTNTNIASDPTSALEKIPTDTHSTPSVQRQSLDSELSSETGNDSFNESEAIAPSSSTTSTPELEPIHQPSENITNENVPGESKIHQNTTTDNIKPLSLKPDENTTVARKSEVFAEGRSLNQSDTGSRDESNHSGSTVDLPDIEKQPCPTLHATEPESKEPVQPQPASQRPTSPAQPDAIATDTGSPLQLKANDSLSKNTAKPSIADEQGAIASPDSMSTDPAEAKSLPSPKQPAIQQLPSQSPVSSKQIERSNEAVSNEAVSSEAVSSEAVSSEAIAPDSAPITADVPSFEKSETTAPRQIQRRLEHQDGQDEQDATATQSLEPLGQSEPLIQKADLFLSRFQTEQDQGNELSQISTERAEVSPTDPTEDIPSNPNDPIHFLTLPEQFIPDHWATLAELLGDDAPPAAPSAQERNSQPELTHSPESSHSAMGEESLPQLEQSPGMRSPAATPIVNSPSSSAEPAEAAIPTAWSSLTELLNESLDSPKLKSVTQNTQETLVSSTAQPKPQQPTKPEDIEINEATMELLTRQIYQAIRSRLVLEQEWLWGHSTSPFPWFEVPGSPALKYLEGVDISGSTLDSPQTHQSTPRISTIHSLDTLNQTIYQLLQQRLEIERERQGYAIASYSRHGWR